MQPVQRSAHGLHPRRVCMAAAETQAANDRRPGKGDVEISAPQNQWCLHDSSQNANDRRPGAARRKIITPDFLQAFHVAPHMGDAAAAPGKGGMEIPAPQNQWCLTAPQRSGPAGGMGQWHRIARLNGLEVVAALGNTSLTSSANCSIWLRQAASSCGHALVPQGLPLPGLKCLTGRRRCDGGSGLNND